MIVKLSKWLGGLFLLLTVCFLLLQLWIDRHRDEFYLKISTALSKSFDGKIEIGDFGFTPFQGGLGLTFSLDDIRLMDQRYREHGAALLEAGRISVSLNAASVFSDHVKIRTIRVRNGSIKAFVRKDGYSNLHSFSRSEPGASDSADKVGHAFMERIKKVRFENFRVSYVDSLHNKKADVFFRDAIVSLSRERDTWNTGLQGSIFFHGLFLTPGKGGFLVKQETLADLKIRVEPDQKKIRLAPSRLMVAGTHKIALSGEFSYDYKPLRWFMNFDTRDIPMAKALRLLPQKIERDVSRFKVLPVVSAEVTVNDSSGTGKPVVHVAFQTDTFHYDFPFGQLTRLKASGVFTNQANVALPPSNSNSMIKASKIDGFFETLPIKSDLLVSNFEKPEAVLKCSLSADPASLNKLFDPKRYRVNDGSLHLNLVYKGNMKKLYDGDKDRINGKIVGEVRIRNASLSYHPQKVNLTHLNSRVFFDQEQIVIRELSVNDSKNVLKINGRVKDLLLALVGSKIQPRAEVNIDIPNWQLNWLQVLLDKQPTPSPTGNSMYKLSKLADDVIDNMEIVGNLRSDFLRYNRFTGRDLRGNIVISNKGISLNYLNMKAFGGSLELSGALVEPSDSLQYPQVNLNGKIVDTRVQSVFYSFNNFGQDMITDRNIKGTLSSDFRLDALLNKDATLVDSSMHGNLNFNLINGSIIDFKPFLKVKKMFFKTRSLEHVQFAPIRNEVEVRGNEVIVKPMEIESNVITLFLEGIYSFGDKTDLMVQIPFSNLKKRDKGYRLTKHDPKALKSLYLRAVQESGEVTIKLDPSLTQLRNKAVNRR